MEWASQQAEFGVCTSCACEQEMQPTTVVAAVVFLHGSGDTGPGLRRSLAGLEQGFASRGVAMHFPSAEPIPYRLANNQVMSVWYDRFALEPSAPEHTDSVLASVARLHALLDSIVASGVPPHRIALGGFSQGGGMALQAGLRWRSDAPTTSDSGADACAVKMLKPERSAEAGLARSTKG